MGESMISVWRVNYFRTKSTFPGKESTFSGCLVNFFRMDGFIWGKNALFHMLKWNFTVHRGKCLFYARFCGGERGL